MRGFVRFLFCGLGLLFAAAAATILIERQMLALTGSTPVFSITVVLLALQAASLAVFWLSFRFRKESDSVLEISAINPEFKIAPPVTSDHDPISRGASIKSFYVMISEGVTDPEVKDSFYLDLLNDTITQAKADSVDIDKLLHSLRIKQKIETAF